MDLSLIYREELMEHIKNPKNKGKIENPDYTVKVTNTSCGDEIILYVKMQNNKIIEVKYMPLSCAISTASASILSDQLVGKTITDIKEISEKTILDNFYSSLTPSRQKCALLIHNALKQLIKQYEEKNK